MKTTDPLLPFFELILSKPWDNTPRLDKFLKLIEFNTLNEEKTAFWRSVLLKMMLKSLACLTVYAMAVYQVIVSVMILMARLTISDRFKQH